MTRCTCWSWSSLDVYCHKVQVFTWGHICLFIEYIVPTSCVWDKQTMTIARGLTYWTISAHFMRVIRSVFLLLQNIDFHIVMRRNVRKCTVRHVRRVKIQSSLCIRAILSESSHHENMSIKCWPPLKPHFYKVKLGFTGVYIIFLFLIKNIDCGTR